MNAYFDIHNLNKAQYPNLAAELEFRNFGHRDSVAEYIGVSSRLLYNVAWGKERLSSDEWKALRLYSGMLHSEGHLALDYLQASTIKYYFLSEPEWKTYILEVFDVVDSIKNEKLWISDRKALANFPSRDEVLAANVITMAGMRHIRHTISSIQSYVEWAKQEPPRDILPSDDVIEPKEEPIDPPIAITDEMRQLWACLPAEDTALLVAFYSSNGVTRRNAKIILGAR